VAAPSSLVELNCLLDNFIPLTKKVSVAKDLALQKEAEALEKILARTWMVLPYLRESNEPSQCPLINETKTVPTGQDNGFRVNNRLTLMEDGPHLVRLFTVEHFGTATPCFEIADTKEISCLDAVKCFGFEAICAGLVEMLKCQASFDVEFRELQARIEKAGTILALHEEKFKVECQADETAMLCANL